MKNFCTALSFILIYTIAFAQAQNPQAAAFSAPQPQAQGSLPIAAQMPQNFQSPQMPQAGVPAGAQVPDAEKQPEQKNPNSSMFPDLDGIEGKIYANFFEKYWIWILSASLLLAAIIYFILRPRRKPAPTPFEIAVASLAKASAESDILTAKQYAADISQSVRNYIEAQHNIPAPEQTTEEFLRLAAHSLVFDQVQRLQLTKVLKLADMAKFAQHSFQQDERRELLGEASEFIQNDHKKIELLKKIKDEPENSEIGNAQNAQVESEVEISDKEQ